MWGLGYSFLWVNVPKWNVGFVRVRCFLAKQVWYDNQRPVKKRGGKQYPNNIPQRLTCQMSYTELSFVPHNFMLHVTRWTTIAENQRHWPIRWNLLQLQFHVIVSQICLSNPLQGLHFEDYRVYRPYRGLFVRFFTYPGFRISSFGTFYTPVC